MFEFLGNVIYVVLFLIALWGAFCVVMVWARVKQKRFENEEGQAIFRERPMGECVNARARQWGIGQFTVRTPHKVGCVMHLFALANNILQGQRLKLQAAGT